jgi:phosphopantothenoylcysteine synthetase/decarboxylase
MLTVIVCGAGPAGHVGQLVAQALSHGWHVQVIATPAGREFIDVAALERQTGRPVRSRYREPGQPRSTTSTDVIIVAPAIYNTINKWASGISDNYALGALAEAPGLKIPVIVLPFVNAALADHPAYTHSLTVLKNAGAHVLTGSGGVQPHPPGTGGPLAESFPWHLALSAAESCIPVQADEDLGT